jgi:hypothetical protein
MATVTVPLDVKSASVAATLIPELKLVAGTNMPVSSFGFDDGTVNTQEDIYFQLTLPLFGVSNTTMSVFLNWYNAATAITGACVWAVAIAKLDIATSVEAASFATASNVTTTTAAVAKAASISNASTVALPTGLLALDAVVIKVSRLGSNGSDTMVGDANLFAAYLQYSDT